MLMSDTGTYEIRFTFIPPTERVVSFTPLVIEPYPEADWRKAIEDSLHETCAIEGCIIVGNVTITEA
jgi:hypothetical protein